MKKYFFLTILLLQALLFNASAKQIKVSASGFSFSPNSFTAAVGDTVNFVWVSGFHTTTSTSVPAGAATWDAPLDASHTSFKYVIKIAGGYAYQCTFHAAMGMLGTFNTPTVAKIALVKATAVNSCSNTNKLKYKCTQSKPPFKVQLFRYSVAFGSVLTVTDTLPFTISNLPIGSYFATADGNNGADATAGKSATSSLMPVPQGVLAANISSTTATIKWNHLGCVKFYALQFRKKGTSKWTSKNTTGNKDSLKLTALAANTTYEFRVASKDSANKITAASKFTAINSFKTKAALIAANDLKNDNNVYTGKEVLIYPNPTANSFTIQANGLRIISAQLRNAEGVPVWNWIQNTSEGNKSIDVNVSNFSGGTYFLVIIDANKKQYTKKIIVER